MFGVLIEIVYSSHPSVRQSSTSSGQAVEAKAIITHNTNNKFPMTRYGCKESVTRLCLM